jgi:hypothetical protein
MRKTSVLAALLGVQAMFGNFGATDDGERIRHTQIQGVGKPGKQRTKKPRQTGAIRRTRHRRTYTHGKVFMRKGI